MYTYIYLYILLYDLIYWRFLFTNRHLFWNYARWYLYRFGLWNVINWIWCVVLFFFFIHRRFYTTTWVFATKSSYFLIALRHNAEILRPPCCLRNENATINLYQLCSEFLRCKIFEFVESDTIHVILKSDQKYLNL